MHVPFIHELLTLRKDVSSIRIKNVRVVDDGDFLVEIATVSAQLIDTFD